VTLYVAFIFNNEWKSGYLPAFASVVVIIALRSTRVGLLIAVVGPMIATYLSSQAVATDEYSYSTRIEAWEIVLNMVKVSPLFGFGPSNYFWYTPLFPIRGYYVNFNSHNQYVDLIAQTGLLGLAGFLWFAVEVGRLGWRLRSQAPAGFAQAYVIGALSGLAGMLVAGMLADWFLPFVYNIGFSGFRAAMYAWLFLGGLVSIERWVRRQSKAAATQETNSMEETVHA
jgi:O-antigen ligase